MCRCICLDEMKTLFIAIINTKAVSGLQYNNFTPELPFNIRVGDVNFKC